MIECLIAVVFFEARDQPVQGQFAVAEVVMNRVESDRWPNGICEVVFQNKQFSFTHDGKSDNPLKYLHNDMEKRAYLIAKSVARGVVIGEKIGISSTHYHRTDVSPYWAKHYRKDGQVGEHIFYTAVDGK